MHVRGRIYRVSVGALVALLVPVASSAAATLNVTTTADSNDGACTATLCSFRDALAVAATGDTIKLPAGTYKGTMLGGNGVWAPSGGPYTIQGAGPGQTIIDGNHLSRTFAFYGQITVTGVTVTGGLAPNAGCACGGAFEVRQGGNLTLINSVVQGNSAPAGGGGIDVDTQSAAALQNVLISQNTSPSNGAGIRVEHGTTSTTGVMTMHEVTISGNSTTAGASGAGLDNAGQVTGTNVTFAGNTAAADGGAIMNESTGILALTNATVATNLATGLGAGIRNLAAAGAVTARNTIVADGCSGTAAPVVTTQGHNLDAGTTCGFTAAGDLANRNPLLGAFGPHGGSTGLPVLPLMAGSPAIDAGDNTTCPTTDARGIARPAGAVCDIGAVEYAAPSVALTGASGISTGAATLNGTVNPRQIDTSYHFSWGPTTAYGNTTPVTGAGSGTAAGAVSAALSGLTPGTTYHFQLVAVNGDGTSTTGDGTFTTAAGTPPPSTTPTAPVLSHVGQSARRWQEGNARPRISRVRPALPTGTTFSLSLDQSARVVLTFRRSLPGRRGRHGCVAVTRSNRHRARCTRTVTAGAVSFTGHSGVNRVRFQGRLSNGRRLPVGSYTLVITAVNASGLRARPQTLRFAIVRPTARR